MMQLPTQTSADGRREEEGRREGECWRQRANNYAVAIHPLTVAMVAQVHTFVRSYKPCSHRNMQVKEADSVCPTD